MSLVNELVEAGIHFGQRRSNWNPKMAPYIHGTKNQIHIVDIRETIKGILLAKKFIQKTVSEGKDVLFVGTKRQAKGAIEKYCTESGMPYITERWLGGLLTNFRTVRDRLKRLQELEQLVESGGIKNYSKKMESQLAREHRKIHRNLNGVRNMTRLPGALIAVDVTRELNALHEARNLGIPTICLIDTDGDPDFADVPIPGNDDSMRSIDIVVRELCAAVNEGKTQRQTSAAESAVAAVMGDSGSAEGGDRTPKRSSRSRFRGEASSGEGTSASPDTAATTAPAATEIA
ncbi:MAG: 30S ribosomal protein S2 [Phycisphaerales bacterium]|nr:30S ribosomal protein S2 [Phycisphaerales bacterium]